MRKPPVVLAMAGLVAVVATAGCSTGTARSTKTSTVWVVHAAGILHSFDSDKTNILSAQLTTLHSALTAPGIAPGAFGGSNASGDNAAMSIIQQVCEDNGVATYVNADYGG